MLNIRERLEQIKSGILTEAEDDNKYNIPKEDTPEEDDNDNKYNIPEGDTPTDTDTSETDDAPPEDTDNENIGDDTDTGDTNPSEPETTDNNENDDTYDIPNDGTDVNNKDNTSDKTNTAATKPNKVSTDPADGAVLALDVSARKVLAYKNFRKYRELRDDVSRTLTELGEIPSFSKVDKNVLNLAIEKATDLLTKLDDYILYRYKDNTYEINFKNFSNFIIEQRLIGDLINTLTDTTNK